MHTRKLSTIALLSTGLALSASVAFAQAQQTQRSCEAETETASQVCFHTETNFGGRYFCEAGCRTVNTVGEDWRNSIKSIEVQDGASVQICNEFSREGDCKNITSSDPELEPDFYNHVYSYRTKD